MKQIHKLRTQKDWEDLKQQDIPDTGCILFKFSPICPISKRIESSFDSWYEQLAADKAPLCMKIDVLGARPLSQQLARELDIRHESPQAIWLTADLQVCWHASHQGINSEALDKQFHKDA